MELVKYNINEAEISKMSDIYMNLVIKDFEDQEGYDAVHTARLVMVKHRCAVDKLRKSTNETAQKFIKNNNANAKKLTGLMEPIETHLKTEEEVVTKEKERLKAEEEAKEKAKIESRVSELFVLGVNVPFFGLAMLSDDDYGILLESAIKKHEAERLRLEEERKAKEIEERKLADERAEIERQKKEQATIAKAQKEKEEALETERKKIEAEKQAEQDRKDKEAFEKRVVEKATGKARFELLQAIGYTYPFDDLTTMPESQYVKMYNEHQKAWDEKQNAIFIEKLKKEQAEKADREARELKEKEEAETAEKARQETLLPDKTKLLNFADTIHVLTTDIFSMKSEDAQALYAATLYTISNLETTFRKEIKEL